MVADRPGATIDGVVDKIELMVVALATDNCGG